MEYKQTLNLPQTEFPMKADLSQREPDILARWQQKDIYRLLRQKAQGHPKYILHDGPPYANGDIHIGHALNKILKDIIVKYKTMQGFDSAYVPGWDCHGLPVEHQLFKELGINKSQISQLEFRKKAYAYALKYVGLQKEQFQRLGVFGDWENPYLTLSPDYEEAIVESLKILVERGYIYRGRKPVNWCFTCETALAEAEVEYEDRSSPSIYVKFKLEEYKEFAKESFLLIWTTTPWTLIANMAVAVHPDFIYTYIKTPSGNLIIAKDLLPSVLTQAGINEYEIIREIKGKNLAGLIYTHPLGWRKGCVVLADYVSRQEGTGLVHTAPGHGNEDYLTGLKYKLEVVMPVDTKGNFDETAAEFKGINVYQANKPILEKLEKSGALVFNGSIKHSYPHCWRCKTPLIFRATKQWFLNIEQRSLRKKLEEAIAKKVNWIPEGGRERMAGMVMVRPDWCLSRQRYWGVPIPAVACQDCQEEFLEVKIIAKFASLTAQEGSDCWFKRELKDFLPEGFSCLHCRGKNFVKLLDILDVWFDSGVSSQAVLKKRKELEFPCALYLEGSDQHRGWFQSSLIPALCIDGQPPFKNVLTHGFVVDGEGRKMSKSLGNVISPFEVINEYGADILRLWVASSDYNEDVRISREILSRISEAYRKIRNTCRFMLSNLYDFHPDKNKIDYLSLKRIDQWILYRREKMLEAVNASYENFLFSKAYKAIYDFCNEDLSMYYLDMVKGRLYTYAPDSNPRRAAQTVIYEILSILVRVTAPLLPFTAEEIWQYLPKRDKDAAKESVHLLDWPKINAVFAQAKITSGLKEAMDLIPTVAASLEKKRSQGLIGSSFDAQIILLTKDQKRYKYLESLKEDLREVFKVSQIQIRLEAGIADEEIRVEKAEGKKCLRCWNYDHNVGSTPNHPLICPSCVEAIAVKEKVK